MQLLDIKQSPLPNATGGGGGFASGTFAVTAGQVLHVSVGEGAQSCGTNPQTSGGRRGGNGFGGSGGGGGPAKGKGGKGICDLI